MSVPCQVQDLCECCRQRPATMLVYLPGPDLPAAAGPLEAGGGVQVQDVGDFFRICGAACDLPTAAAALAGAATTARRHGPGVGGGYGRRP